MATLPPGTPTQSGFHVSVGGIPSGPYDEGRARDLAREQVAAQREVLVWCESWPAWLSPAQVWPPEPARLKRTTTATQNRLPLLVLLLVALLAAVVFGPEAIVPVLIAGPFVIVGWFAVAHLIKAAPTSTNWLRIGWGAAVLLILLAVAIAYFIDRHEEKRRWDRAADEVRRIENSR